VTTPPSRDATLRVVLHHLVDPVRGDRSLHRPARVVLHRPEERSPRLTPMPREVGVNIEGFGAHSLRATAATNALDHEADIVKVQEWLGHVNIATTRLYDRRKTRPEDNPTFKVRY
jgi:integrase